MSAVGPEMRFDGFPGEVRNRHPPPLRLLPEQGVELIGQLHRRSLHAKQACLVMTELCTRSAVGYGVQ